MREGDYLRWKLDPVAFAEAIGMRPDPWQVEMLRSRSTRMLLNCSRQSGKSSSVAVLALWRALCFPNSLVLCLSPSLRQSSELFNKVATYYADLGKPVSTKEEQKLSIRFDNRSRVVALPSNEATVRGFSKVDLCLIDEAARVSARLFHSVTPMLATSKGGRMILLSTPQRPAGTVLRSLDEGWRQVGEVRGSG
jgi:phage terminase large subunit-like protein